MGRNRYALVAVAAFIVIAVGWAFLRTSPSDPSAPAAPSAGLPTCSLTTLPREAADTVRVIHSGGPFPFPHNDGAVFGNREGHLPNQTRGYYHEYTVTTPGAKNRSTRRIITGGAPLTDPRQYFYTADHYDSFCLVTDAGGQ
ncbi:MAG: ribonuclease [Mycobacterium sp.]|nr:ribonuclease [Mycobacterium sp.]